MNVYVLASKEVEELLRQGEHIYVVTKRQTNRKDAKRDGSTGRQITRNCKNT